MTRFFSITDPIRYEGPETSNPLAYRWYEPGRKVLGKTLKEHLRFAVCYWHSLCWTGIDPFGGPTIERPWISPTGDQMALARQKADVAFEMFRLLDVPYFTFHDRDIAPEGATLAESNRNVSAIAEIFARKMQNTGVKLLWGTANMFSHRRFMAGAATNPDPDVFAWCAAQVKHALEVTHQLGGENYVMWGGREGYETLINTDLKRELAQAGRFLQLVVEHKHKIGFKGPILIEPKPHEPTKHQYDFDTQTVYAWARTYPLSRVIAVKRIREDIYRKIQHDPSERKVTEALFRQEALITASLEQVRQGTHLSLQPLANHAVQNLSEVPFENAGDALARGATLAPVRGLWRAGDADRVPHGLVLRAGLRDLPGLAARRRTGRGGSPRSGGNRRHFFWRRHSLGGPVRRP